MIVPMHSRGAPPTGTPVDGDPQRIAEDALLLLRSGRSAMALKLMERLPAQIEAAMDRMEIAAYREGRDGERRTQAGARARKAAQVDRLAVLRAALADPERRARLRAAMQMEDWLLDRVASGTATFTGAQWHRVREALA